MKQQSWWWCALRLMTVGVLAVAAGRAQDLRLQVQVDGVWQDVLGMTEHKLCVGAAARPIAPPAGAEFRLTGDLVANWPSLQTTLTWSIASVPGATVAGRAPEWGILVQPDLGNSVEAVARDRKTAIPVWNLRAPDRAVLVIAWVVDGVAQRLAVRELCAYANGAVGAA